MDDSTAFESSDDPDTDADWEGPYRAILDACLPDCFSVGDGAATVPRANALAGLGDWEPGDEEPSDDDPPDDPSDGDPPDAERAADLLASLDAAGVVERAGDSVAVLFDPDDERPLTSERWRVAADLLAAEIERLDAEVLSDEAPGHEAEIDAKLQSAADEIRELGSGEDVPDPDDLDAEESERFRQLRQKIVHYKQLQEANTDPVGALSPTLTDWTDRLGELPEDSTDALGEFGTAVEVTAALRTAVEADDSEAVRDRYERLAELLDG
ncbi:hypothetical protein [Halorussus salinus]|uniref:hypothetical protein n=1 Tax=Halorussus salinus TaxID=1364935 RepID=UPI0010920EBB|nr:hypothetical protein [Halorussus salinus]